ncbi:hypothetical protein ACWF5S_14980 [Peribacillus butanolivorans]|uniref:hypothetical protein n=1 Tax=Peribacillus butanolivorans TaxID=421767 RepID=UPI0036A91C47
MTLENFNEIKKRVENGEEFSFDYKNEEYWISQNPDEYYLTRVRVSLTQEFDTSKALFENGTIKGRKLFEIYMDIDWN